MPGAGSDRANHRAFKNGLPVGAELSAWRAEHPNQCPDGGLCMEFEENDGKTPRERRSTFLSHFFRYFFQKTTA
jgi:hypothetical protein